MQNSTIKSYQKNLHLLSNLAGKLDGLSPLATLKRGFSIATKGKHILRQAKEIRVGDKINVQLMQGELGCTVETVTE